MPKSAKSGHSSDGRQPASETHTTLELIKLIYDSVADASRWPVFLNTFLRSVRARRGLLAIRSISGVGFMPVCWSGWPDEDIQLYTERYAAADPWHLGGTRWPEGPVATDREIWPRDDMEASTAFRDFYAPRDCVNGIGATILLTDAAQSAITMVRGAADGPFGPPEKEVLEPLMPHLRRAALLHGELGSVRSQLATFTGHLDRYPHALLLSDSERRVLFANRAAREFADLRDGFAVNAGRISMLSPRENDAFQEALETISRGLDSAFQRLEVSRSSQRKLIS